MPKRYRSSKNNNNSTNENNDPSTLPSMNSSINSSDKPGTNMSTNLSADPSTNPSTNPSADPSPNPSPNPSPDLISQPRVVQEPVEISGVSLIIPEEPKALESFFKPHEMKRQIADALKETGKSKRAQMRSKRAKANVTEFNALFGGKKSGRLSGPEVSQMLHYADVVRKNNKENIFEHGKLDKISEESDAQSFRKQMDFAIKEAMREKSEERTDSQELRDADPENQTTPQLPADAEDVSQSKKNSICQLLGGIDPEVLSELELDDTNWEVISVDGWSHCGSDTDDQFYLISRDDGLALHSFDEDSELNDEDEGTSAGVGGSEGVDQTDAQDKDEAKDSTRVKEDLVSSFKEPNPSDEKTEVSIEPLKKTNNKKTKKGGSAKKHNTSRGSSASPSGPDSSSGGGASSVVTTPIKKKKVVVTRKYVGKEDFGEKLVSLGFKPAAEYGKRECQQWSGTYGGCEVAVSTRVLCGVLLVTLRAEADALLTALTVLQGLTANTGLLSYTSLTLPALPPANPAC